MPFILARVKERQLSQIMPADETVVIVDDDAAVCQSLGFLLELEGFRILTFSNAFDALESQQLERACCLVIDFKMPQMNGLQLIEALRARGVVPPIIMISGCATEGLRQAAVRQGVSMFVEKPLMDVTLTEHVLEACAARSGGSIPTSGTT